MKGLKDQKPPTRFSTNFKTQQKPLELNLTKKCFYLLFLILTVFPGCSLVKPRIIPDRNLASAVRAELGLDSNDPILEKDLRELKRLTAINRGIKKLTGLEKAANLRGLWLNLNKIRNITPLARLTQLTHLELSDNEVHNITPLADVTELNTFWIAQLRCKSETSNEIFNQFQNTAETPGAEPYEKPFQ